jgi:1,4-dihydroxy-2-naphthoate octaprenyltransferase
VIDMNLKELMGPMRLPFLILTPVCVLLGIGTAYWSTGQINALYAILALIGGVAAHISVNAFNEYFDFKSGLDEETERTPFSGGSGTLQAHPELGRQALQLAIISLLIVALIGVYFMIVWGWSLLPLGLLGLLIIFAYTPWLTLNAFACLIAPGLGFGTLMVTGTNFVLMNEYTGTAFMASLVPFFLVSDLLLLNQFPDVDADRTVGRLHFPIVIGRKNSSLIYAAFLAAAYLSILLGVLTGYLPVTTLFGLLTIFLAVPVALGVHKNADDIPNLLPFMGKNVLINILTPVLVAIGLFLG